MIKKYAFLLPLIILVAICISAVYEVITTNYVFDNRQYLGLTFVFFSLVAALVRKDWGIYLTGVTLLLGIFTFIAFTVAVETYSIGFGSGTNLKIQPIPLMLFFLFLALNYRTLLSLIRREISK